MKKLESNFQNMVLVMFGVCLVSSLALGLVYNLTKTNIEFAKEQKKLTAIEEVVVGEFDNQPLKEAFQIGDNDKLDVFPAQKAGEVTSYAIKTFSKNGFSGLITLMVGLLPDGTINKISVLEQKETPGLGTKIVESKFKSQFEGKKAISFRVKKDGGEIDAVTAATISSRAFCDAVERASQAYTKYQEQKGQQ